MKKHYHQTSKTIIENDFVNIGRLHLIVKKECGLIDTNENQRKAEEIAKEWSNNDFFYGKDSHCLLLTNGRLFAAAKLKKR